MSADIRIEIEHYEDEAATIEHEVLPVMLGIARETAKNALTRL